MEKMAGLVNTTEAYQQVYDSSYLQADCIQTRIYSRVNSLQLREVLLSYLHLPVHSTKSRISTHNIYYSAFVRFYVHSAIHLQNNYVKQQLHAYI